ncbi:kinase-like domain-containing protein [Aspergillus falconensis]
MENKLRRKTRISATAMSISPPPTPPSRPLTDNERRFKTITLPCEWVEDYRPGAYHLVVLGDVFNDGQYKVIRKFGEGSYSTVWLAHDLKNTTDLRHIAKTAPEEAVRYVARLLDEFEHRGPNGAHRCLEFEPMGPNVNTMPLPMAKSIIKQSLQALAFLHENVNWMPEDVLWQEEDRLDGKQDKWAPQYLYVAQSLVPFTSYSEGFKVKLSDMGGAYLFTDPLTKPITALGLRAPELILTEAVDNTVDVWSFGCLVFELITRQPLFCIPGSNGLPDEFFGHWKTLSLYFTPERKLFNCQLGVAPGEGPLMVEQTSMEGLFDGTEPDLDEEEAHKVKALIR